jgi:hypothetical protein
VKLFPYLFVVQDVTAASETAIYCQHGRPVHPLRGQAKLVELATQLLPHFPLPATTKKNARTIAEGDLGRQEMPDK